MFIRTNGQAADCANYANASHGFVNRIVDPVECIAGARAKQLRSGLHDELGAWISLLFGHDLGKLGIDGVQKVAIGLTGEPVPPTTGIGAIVMRKSQRFRAAAASLSASRSQLSIRWIPR